jgi:hypothetical protein
MSATHPGARVGALTRIWHPARYQGGATRSDYFEGWYFKVVDPTGDLVT